MIENKKPAYIMSLEASDIFYHEHRDSDIRKEYVGMIPFSLELIKLVEYGFKVKHIQKRDKYISDDIINVKFNSKAKNAREMIDLIDKKIEYMNNSIKNEKSKLKIKKKEEAIDRLEDYKVLLYDNYDEWESIASDELRKLFYSEGFSITTTNQRTGKSKTIKYIAYKRSSAKSRTGQCLFIKESLYSKMIKWSRMSLPLRKNMKIDLASLLAYESLVGSSLEDTIVINPEKILLVDDVDSNFREMANVVRQNKVTGFLDSFKEFSDISNSLFDGEALLESKYFPEEKSMMLLRNHMFKSASFNCNIQQFLKDNVPEDIVYDDWKIKNMFGEEMYAKDIEMITTPSSIKALKFSHVLKSKKDKDMWNHWKEKVKEDGNIFGICKYEKKSKIGETTEGVTLQQTSYQMLNCLPVNEKDINILSEKERQYIDKLKNDDDFFIYDVYKNIDDVNSNEMVCELYRINNDIIHTQALKKFRYQYVDSKITHAKKGKIKINGDYCVLLGNPMEFLEHSIGEIDYNNLSLKDNQVYCSAYKNEEELIGFRNPNTSPSNVLIMENKKCSKIDRYFNLNENIIAVNAIDFPIQDILSGCDYDSDTMLVSNEKHLVEVGKKCFRKYEVCINAIQGKKKDYYLNNECHYDIDNQLSHSQRNIGRVVNLGQLCMSAYWDLINNGIDKNNTEVSELLKKVDVMTVLSGIAIDMAKKFYDIEMSEEINYVSKTKALNEKDKKPNFWVYVSQNKNIKNNVEEYKCPMDFLINELSTLDRAHRKDSINMEEFLKDYNVTEVNSKHLEKVNYLLDEYRKEQSSIHGENKEKEILYNKLTESTEDYSIKFSNLKLQPSTIAMIIHYVSEIAERNTLTAMKILYKSNKEYFLEAIKPHKI